jgi:hypothetical protein
MPPRAPSPGPDRELHDLNEKGMAFAIPLFL